MYQFINNIKRLLYWLPVIWHDRPWSGEYGVMTILHHKLADMEQYLNGSDSMAVHSEKHLRKLKIAKNLAKRLAEDVYIHNATMFEESKFDNWRFPDEETGKWFHIRCLHSYYLEFQDRHMLYKILKKYLPYWWD